MESQIDFKLPLLVSKHSNRQNYVFDLIFKQLLGINYYYVDSSFTEKVLSYGVKGRDFYQAPHSLLYEEEVKEQHLEFVEYQGNEFPFKVDGKKSIFSFDLFSVCFYCVSRYEEYTTNDLDIHGRFKPESSWVYSKNLLKTPVVNYLAEELKISLEAYFGVNIKPQKKYSVIPTVDVDNAYAYYNSFGSAYGSMLKSLLQLKFREFKVKKEARKDHRKDPFNTHKKIIDLTEGLESKIFILMVSGGMDSTNNTYSEAQNKLIEMYENSHFEIGLHPSYKSLIEPSLKEEFNNLSQEVSQVNNARYHYIKNLLPISYYALIDAGIKADYSMGYATETGFRAGICSSFLWYDVLNDAVSPLTVYPFYFMDATYIFNLKQTPDESLVDAKKLTAEVKKYRGINSFIFHNESLSGYGVYKGWEDFMEKTLDSVK